MAEPTPEATELVYVPEPSFRPALFAFGLAGVLAGIIVWWPYGVIGAVVALAAALTMLRASRSQVERLPSRQKTTTAVLPPN
ncbi:MAG: hypothetical protein M3383_00695 [Actinomycetota bacterium]|nr:hypothetical protein [Actinomycetota bacterium]